MKSITIKTKIGWVTAFEENNKIFKIKFSKSNKRSNTKGHTKSYGDLAKKFNLSPRYIGKICGQNKLPLIIPCHRVIKSDGSLGGFSGNGGIKLKEKILKFEREKRSLN